MTQPVYTTPHRFVNCLLQMPLPSYGAYGSSFANATNWDKHYGGNPHGLEFSPPSTDVVLRVSSLPLPPLRDPRKPIGLPSRPTCATICV